MEQIAGRLSMICFLDVSYCMKMSARGLEVIGKNCKLLEGLCRNMKQWDTGDPPLRDDEATAIASTMPNLKHLEMAYHVITTEGVRQVLCGCPKLEFLDVRGCKDAGLGKWVRKQKFQKLTVLGPHGFYDDFDFYEILDCYEDYGYDDVDMGVDMREDYDDYLSDDYENLFTF